VRYEGCTTRYNQEGPHQALDMQVPADRYTRSARLYRGLDDLSYPFADATFSVTHCRICFHGRKINLRHVFAGQNVDVTQVGDHVWLVSFMHYDLGYFDDEGAASSRSRIRSARKCDLCARYKPSPM